MSSHRLSDAPTEALSNIVSEINDTLAKGNGAAPLSR